MQTGHDGPPHPPFHFRRLSVERHGHHAAGSAENQQYQGQQERGRRVCRPDDGGREAERGRERGPPAADAPDQRGRQGHRKEASGRHAEQRQPERALGQVEAALRIGNPHDPAGESGAAQHEPGGDRRAAGLKRDSQCCKRLQKITTHRYGIMSYQANRSNADYLV